MPYINTPDPSQPGGFNPPTGPTGGGGNRGSGGAGGTGTVGTSIRSFQLITSTGGILGVTGFLMTPGLSKLGKPVIIVEDPNNFDCEDSAEYDFRQEANYGDYPGEGRSCSIHRIVLKYRELGIAKFNINITVYKQKPVDDFVTVSIPVNIPQIPLDKMTKQRQRSFPDKRIHTVILTPPKGVIQGERPQVTTTRLGNSGPYSITKLVLCGNADELSQQ